MSLTIMTYVWFLGIVVLEVAHGDDKNQDDFPPVVDALTR
jgi:hypothetical protein